MVSDTAIRHILSQHGDFLTEALRAQFPMTEKDIARHLSAVKDGKLPTKIEASSTSRGKASIITAYEINGYTLYAEEIKKPLEKNSPSGLIGHTMYKAPTLATAPFGTTSVTNQPKRQSLVLCEYNNTQNGKMSTGNFVVDLNRNPAILYYLKNNNVPKEDAWGEVRTSSLFLCKCSLMLVNIPLSFLNVMRCFLLFLNVLVGAFLGKVG